MNNNSTVDCVCFKNGECRALTDGVCTVDKSCRFYKSREQALDERDMVFKRLRRLPQARQRAIADTYYNHKMAWN